MTTERVKALTEAIGVANAYAKENNDGAAKGYEDARAKQLAAEEIARRIEALAATPAAEPVRVVGGENPLEVEVSTAKAEESFNRLRSSMDGASDASERLVGMLTRVEAVLGRLKDVGSGPAGITLNVVGDVLQAQAGDPRVAQVRSLLEQVQKKQVTPGVAMVLLEVLGVSSPQAHKAVTSLANLPEPYTPPAELVAQATADWEAAQQVEKNDAARLYECLIARPGRRSAVSGASLPPLPECSPLVRAGWLDVAREVRNWVA